MYESYVMYIMWKYWIVTNSCNNTTYFQLYEHLLRFILLEEQNDRRPNLEKKGYKQIVLIVRFI